MKKIIIFGGTSLISIELLKKFEKETEEFLIISRNNLKLQKQIETMDENLKKKIQTIELDILNLEDNIYFINKLNDYYYDGLIFLIGETGNPDLEFEDYKICLQNYKVNLLHPVVVINCFVKKIKKNSFICVFSSIAGIRGRELRIFYCSAKSGLISYFKAYYGKYENQTSN